MDPCEEIRVFLVAVEDARHDPAVMKATHIPDLPESLKDGLARAIKAVADARHERGVVRRAAELLPSAGTYPAGLGEAIQALTRVLIDNDAFDLP
jgi:hypothetical protein